MLLFDELLMDYIHKNTNSIGLSIMKFMSFLGSATLFLTVGLSIIVYFWRNEETRKAKLMLLSIVGSFSLNIILKTIFSRTRPLDYMLVQTGGYSFPSGHSMVSMSFYTTLTYILLEKVEDKKTRILIWMGNFVLIGLIGISRLYLGVHWPTDVIAGFILGFIFFLVNKKIIK